MRKTFRNFVAGLVVLKAVTLPLYAHVQTDWKMALDDLKGKHAAVAAVSDFARARRLERKLKAREMNQEQKLMQLSPGLSWISPPDVFIEFSSWPATNAQAPEVAGQSSASEKMPYLLQNTIPVIKLKALKLEASSDCQLLVQASAFDNGTTDADGDELTFTFFEDGSEERSFPIGNHTVEIEVFDGSNYTRASTTLKVEDKTAPVAIAKAISLELNASGAASITAEDINDGSSDSCSTISLSVSQTDFDCSHVGENEVILTVTDGNGNIATNTAIVTIVDKVLPVVPSAYSFTTDENAAQGTLLGTILATDNCSKVSYYIKAGNVSGVFSINSNNGALVVANSAVLDYETIKQFTLLIEAADNSDNAVTTEVQIALNNLNDNAPEAETSIGATQQILEDESYSFTLPEAAFTDADEDDELTYSAPALPAWLLFNEETMVISGIPLNEHVGTHQIKIRATDKAGQSAEQTYQLQVTNVNDAPHTISLSNNEMLENEVAGTFVGALSTLDVDAGDSHTYSLAAGEGDTDNASFTVEGTELSLASPLNFEEKEYYTVRIRATDLEGVSYEEMLRIRVTDVPDSEPFLPNLFSPNGDGSNDLYILRAYNLEQVQLRIYNKQGALVYETTNIAEATQKGWDGTNNGKAQPEGNYVWQVRGMHKDGKPLAIEGKNVGSFSLIR